MFESSTEDERGGREEGWKGQAEERSGGGGWEGEVGARVSEESLGRGERGGFQDVGSSRGGGRRRGRGEKMALVLLL